MHVRATFPKTPPIRDFTTATAACVGDKLRCAFWFAVAAFRDSMPNMDPTDAERMEKSLIAGADAAVELRFTIFERFFAVWPGRRATFLNLDAASRRMTDETLEMLMGLAKGQENWVWPLAAEMAANHRGYGDLPWAEFESWIALTIDAVRDAAGPAWDDYTEAAWGRQAERLKTLLWEAREGWERAMPAKISGQESLPHG